MNGLIKNIVGIVKNNKILEKTISTVKNGKKRRRHHPYDKNIDTSNKKKFKIESLNLIQTQIDDIEKKNYYRKEGVPKRIRELVWTTYNGEVFSKKCFVSWCDNHINVFNFQVGHDIPESKGGTLEISNLKPICGNCNQSMGNKYTITEWNELVITDDNDN